MLYYPLKLLPSLKEYLWGGTKLKEEYNKETTLSKVAESWELSCHKDGQSIILNGSEKGSTFSNYIKKYGKSVLGTRSERFSYFPLLIKLIDAKEDLSVQVHPDNEYAMRVEGEYGKTEMWYIVDCDPGASLLYGFNQSISKNEFENRIKNNTLLEVCNRVPVHKGDVFFIEAGTLHAIGKGILIAEIQQNSNTTYRIYDYGRIGKDGNPRDLHVSKALEVTNLEKARRDAPVSEPLDFFDDYEVRILAECEYFKVYHINLQGDLHLKATPTSFLSMLLLDGKMTISYEGGEIELIKGDSLFIPAGNETYDCKGNGSFILSKL
jgi:mannose-6-phosphate isomerase